MSFTTNNHVSSYVNNNDQQSLYNEHPGPVLPGSFGPDTINRYDPALVSMCNELSSQYYFSDYNKTKRSAAFGQQQQQQQRSLQLNSSKPFTGRAVNKMNVTRLPPRQPVPQYTAASSPMFARHLSDNENSNTAAYVIPRPSSPRKDEFGDTKMSTSPTRSGRISPSRPPQSSSLSSSHGKMDAMSMALTNALTETVETPLVSRHVPGKPFQLPAVLGRSYSASNTHETISKGNLTLSRTSSITSSSHAKTPSQQIKTSDSHPMHVSAILPADYLPRLSYAMFSRDPIDGHQPFPATDWIIHQQTKLRELVEDSPLSSRPLGNLFLSSCPGKKVRLTGPIVDGGRGAICRDLKTDLERFVSEPLSVRTVVCCLDNAELEFLGVSWRDYELAAKDLDINIVRMPILEGYAPPSVQEVDVMLDNLIRQYTLKGHNVLVHCRGGVGRAGSVAAAWMAKMGLIDKLGEAPADDVVKSVIRYVRERRSTKAIETPLQVLFLHQYIAHLQQNAQVVLADLLV